MEKSNVLIEIIEEKVDCEVDIETPVMVSKLVWRSKEETQAARDLLSSITSLISLCESDPTGNGENSSTRASNIVSLVSDYLSMIPTHIVHDAEVHIIDFMFSESLCHGLDTFRELPLTRVPASLRLRIENDVRLLAFFSRYWLRAVEDHVRLKGQSLPLTMDDDLYNQPCYLCEIDFFRTVLSKRSDDLRWLLEHKNSISSNSRGYLLMKMFPEVKFDFEKQHKMLIDRSQILTESFKHLSLGTSRFPFSSICPSNCRRFFPDPAPAVHRHLNYFAFAGRVIALALMYKVQVGISFDRVFFLQLAGGVVSLEDIRDADPVMYKSCKKILLMDADLVDSDVLGLTFVREFEEFGSRRVVELCPGGNSIIVNSKNREEYIELLIQHCFVKSIAEKLSYFARGFSDILCERDLQKIFFQSLELKDLDLMLLGSSETISVKDWKAHTEYHGYEENDDLICWFWEVVEGMSMKQRQELLFFWTSVKFLPACGFSNLASRLCIFKQHLPSSRTCFYKLGLPQYSSLAVMKQNLLVINQEHLDCSFGFS
ncbi:hypothetical protein MKW98_012104 [Papaver atlanticum]|uniref:HECT-type E3 ubiquitin transferase n=1 Tax=Papaver atlanticum TaxID=357466 RepID=A0AAD4TEJ9_9MAGN|nr:hypothetical protein MKW98_012104 [Papaver atlanticum]